MIQKHFQLPRSAPEAQGISSDAVLAFADASDREELGVHSLMILRHGQVIAEGWWTPYGPTYPHMLFSLSKSFTATAAGLAIAEGLLSLDDPVLSFFPSDTPAHVSANLAALHVRHLLSMSTGHAQDTTGSLRDGTGGNWARAFLAQPIEYAPGTHFVYNSGATYMVSAIVQAVTGSTVLDFLRPRLFDPLGITEPTWENSPQGINVGGWGLSIKTEDIARFGQLYLQRGVWQGQRLLPESWVAEATAKHVSNGDDPISDWAQGYGFQFWRCRHGAYRGDGAFGQYCVVLPEQEAVIAMTAGSSDMHAMLNLVWEHLLPALGHSPLPEEPAARERLSRRLAALSLPVPAGQPASPTAARVSGRTYTFPLSEPLGDSDSRISAITIEFSEHRTLLTVHDKHGAHHLESGTNGWHRGTTTLGDGTPRLVAVQGIWETEDTYLLSLCAYETPFCLTFTLRFTENRLNLVIKQNVGFGPTERPPLEGHWL